MVAHACMLRWVGRSVPSVNRNETLVSVRDRLESEGKFVDERQAKIKAEHHAIADR